MRRVTRSAIYHEFITEYFFVFFVSLRSLFCRARVTNIFHSRYPKYEFECIFVAIMSYVKYQKVFAVINDDHKTWRCRKTYDFVRDPTRRIYFIYYYTPRRECLLNVFFLFSPVNGFVFINILVWKLTTGRVIKKAQKTDVSMKSLERADERFSDFFAVPLFFCRT